MSGLKPRGPRRPLLTAPLKQPPRIYPLRDWNAPYKEIVFQALYSAWKRLVDEAETSGGALLEEQEPAITVRLERALNDIQNEPGHPSGFSGSIFQTVVCCEVTSYDQKKLEKRPDLAFRLISVEPGLDRSLFALFAECKLVGPNNPIRLYCGKGIQRFVYGDYAWAMPTGLMVGYTRRPTPFRATSPPTCGMQGMTSSIRAFCPGPFRPLRTFRLYTRPGTIDHGTSRMTVEALVRSLYFTSGFPCLIQERAAMVNEPLV
jgi:hypothetical protein